ncbi:hypothetical protein FH972_025489 [Carpinus fangiana]|uniref:J domain-containing protein n=1 Tax=Carpinus fangiana TaxID=176857 RepID=A0A5N6L270_9ROSI|nr:hypothetical protein FH972_025489 [Carpinus fangiana]
MDFEVEVENEEHFWDGVRLPWSHTTKLADQQRSVPANRTMHHTLFSCSTFILIILQKRSLYPETASGMPVAGLDDEAGLHRVLIELAYEMSRMHQLSWDDLMAVEDAFILYVLQIIESLANDVNDPYHSPSIRLLLVLNEQYMVSSHTPSDQPTNITNRIMKALSLHGRSYKTFGENLILLLNRESETSLQLLILKLLYLVFTTPSTQEYFYTNDLYVLTDILTRNLLDLPSSTSYPAAVPLKHTYLRVLYPLLANTQLRYPPYYKRDQLRKGLAILANTDSHFDAPDETTLRLVGRCLGVDWLRDQEDDSPLVTPLEEQSTGGSGAGLIARRALGMDLVEGRQSSLSVVEMATQKEKPGIMTPSRGRDGTWCALRAVVMIIRLHSLALGASVLFTALPLAAQGLSPADVASDTPINQILALASSALSSGSAQDALAFYDLAISRDPSNYLTFFKRGATYLSIGRSQQAQHDFDRVLTIKPGFEGALVQRAKIHARSAEWKKAVEDYVAAGRNNESEEIQDIAQAERSAKQARVAESEHKWEECVQQASVAIMIAGGALDLRRRRVHCRLEKGEILEALSDLQHVLALNPSATEPALMISAMMYYSQGERAKGIEAVRNCLHSDPDSKPCSKLFKRQKKLDKAIKAAEALAAKRSFNKVVSALVTPTNPSEGEDEPEPGLIDMVKHDMRSHRSEKIIHPKAPEELLAQLLEMTCNAYVEMNNHKRAQHYCNEAIAHNPDSLPALIHKAQSQLSADDFEACLQTIAHAQKHAIGAQQSRKLNDLHQKAQVALKRSKTKDYYKVLDLDRDATTKEIKKAYLKLSKIHHPDKATSAEARPAAEKKMAQINEAYEVLSDPELKARYDQGDDPNDPQNGQQGHPGGNPFGGGFGGPGGPQFVFQQGGFKFPGGGFPF